VLRHPRKFGASGPDGAAKPRIRHIGGYCVLGIVSSITAHDTSEIWNVDNNSIQ
jgi:hypothetical protein